MIGYKLNVLGPPFDMVDSAVPFVTPGPFFSPTVWLASFTIPANYCFINMDSEIGASCSVDLLGHLEIT